ncbi:uncharacterized protein [Haliotis cracherodii]|uniref:uncharacterized protein n=1 Tax=Haliotis cracherodii TaxID=6455 RepID=UPI0039EC0925
MATTPTSCRNTFFRRDLTLSEDRIHIHGRLRIIHGIDWNPDFLYSNTSAFVDLEDKIINLLDSILLSSSLSDNYHSAVIQGFREGSVEVDFTIVLKTPNTTSNSSSDNSTTVIDGRTLTGVFMDALSNSSSNFSVETNQTNFFEVVIESAASIISQTDSTETLSSLMSSYLELTTQGQSSDLAWLVNRTTKRCTADIC